jgi:alpha-glucosidase
VLAPYSPGLGRNVERLEYSHAYYRDFHDYTRQQLGTDRVNTSRPIDNYGLFDGGGDLAAFTPVDIGWAGWVGDQDASFDGLQAALSNLYYSAEYGYVASGSDIGGYRTDGVSPQGRTKEVFLRWAQQGAFMPIMENGGGGRHEPWAFDEQTVDIYRTFVNLHHALIPHLNEQGGIAFANGESLTTFVDKADYSYFLGPDIFVAPMLDDSVTRTLNVPEGDWAYLFDQGVALNGGDSTTLDVPIDAFPVLVRAKSPLLPLLTAALAR